MRPGSVAAAGSTATTGTAAARRRSARHRRSMTGIRTLPARRPAGGQQAAAASPCTPVCYATTPHDALENPDLSVGGLYRAAFDGQRPFCRCREATADAVFASRRPVPVGRWRSPERRCTRPRPQAGLDAAARAVAAHWAAVRRTVGFQVIAHTRWHRRSRCRRFTDRTAWSGEVGRSAKGRRGSSYPARTRTWNGRTKTCCVANYTTG